MESQGFSVRDNLGSCKNVCWCYPSKPHVIMNFSQMDTASLYSLLNLSLEEKFRNFLHRHLSSYTNQDASFSWCRLYGERDKENVQLINCFITQDLPLPSWSILSNIKEGHWICRELLYRFRCKRDHAYFAHLERTRVI